jgi:hypothetical protein
VAALGTAAVTQIRTVNRNRIHGDGSNSNGLPGEQGERSDPESRASSQLDPNLSMRSQSGGDDETKTEGSNSGNQSDFH